MGTPSKPVNLRLPAPIAEKLDKLADAMPEIKKATLLRLLVASALNEPLHAQVERIQRSLINPAALEKSSPAPNRLNSSRPSHR